MHLETMKRDEDLLEKLLLRAEGEEPAPDFSEYSNEERAYHTAILIDSGLVRGVINRDAKGRVRATATTELTPQGHDYLEARRKERQVSATQSQQIDVFVSHSHRDVALAKEIVELLVLSLGIPTARIRCTSLDGYRLEAGVLVTDQLQQEVFESRLVLALLTPTSLKSAYVLFELGARWGAKKKIIPLLAAEASNNDLEGPMKGINAIQCDRAGIMQMLSEMGRFLGRPWDNPAVSDSKIQLVIKAQEACILHVPENNLSVPILASGYSKQDILSVLESWLSKVGDLSNRVINFDDLDSELCLPSGSAERYLEYVGRERKKLRVVRRGQKTVLFQNPTVDPNSLQSEATN